jgi:site-specific DNA-methyltransferase (adenine-specific)
MDDPDHKIDGPEPITDAARRWQGWGTALKPAWEPILLARKPMTGTVAENVLAHGTGALNVDGCRVGSGGQLRWEKPRDMGYHGGSDSGTVAALESAAGRWPPNVVLDEDAAERLDAQSGERPGRGDYRSKCETPSAFTGQRDGFNYGDSGGASRFFYCAKASKAERGPGCDHPTVKPLALMKWLVTLITPPGGLVLDPFLGSGTTALACQELGFRCVGIELNPEYVEIAKQRLAQMVMEMNA